MQINKTKQTIEAYDLNALKYASKFNNYPPYIKKINEFQHKYIKNYSKILDIACGPANNIQTITQNDDSCSITGVDLSSEFIHIAKTKFPNFRFLQCDMRKLPFSEKFDIILASFCIVHLTNTETSKLLKDISKLLEQNGHFYLSFMEGKCSGFESTSFSNEKLFFNYYDREVIQKLLHQNNLNILDISTEQYSEEDGLKTTDVFVYAKKC